MKEIEKVDSRLTPGQQIERLCRPGATYANLNPFDVLQVTPETPLEEIKKQFRRLSILVHPDKNPDDADKSQKAFDGNCVFVYQPKYTSSSVNAWFFLFIVTYNKYICFFVSQP